jgi:hypothetical protein
MGLAEDAASEAFSAAMNSLEGLRDTRRFSPWLRTIVVRTARRLSNAQSINNGLEAQLVPDAKSVCPSDRLEQRELATLIYVFLASVLGMAFLVCSTLSAVAEAHDGMGISSWASWNPKQVTRAECPELRSVPLILHWNKLEPEPRKYEFDTT